MKKPFFWMAGLFSLFICVNPGQAQGTAFTYQGGLNYNGSPANGNFDFQFSLYPADTGGAAIAGPVTNAAVSVSNGQFTVMLDFGAGAFTGENRFLEIGVGTNGAGTFSVLAPRQPVSATPYAIFANSVSNLVGALPATQLSGTVPLTQLPAVVVTNHATGVDLGGTFSGQLNGPASLASNVVAGLSITNAMITNSIYAGDGGGLTNLRATALAGTVALAQLPSAVVTNTRSGVTLNGTFSGNGLGLTNLSAANLTGTLGLAQIPTLVVTNNKTGVTLTGTFSGNGAGLTNLNAANLAGGTLALARLPGVVVTNNAASVNLGGTFSGTINAATLNLSGPLNPGSLTAGSVSDGYATLTGGNLTGVGTLNATTVNAAGTVSANSLSASGLFIGGVTLANGTLSGVNSMNLSTASVSGWFSAGNLTVGGVTLYGSGSLSGNMSGLADVSAANVYASGYSTADTMAAHLISVSGQLNAGSIYSSTTVTANGVVLTSDRHAKENFVPLDTESVLGKVIDLPVSQWNYKCDPAQKRHFGPMAQDFQAAFGLNGNDDKHISVGDGIGVALAAIQGLNQKLEAENDTKTLQINELRQQVAELKALVTEMAKQRQ